MALARQQDDDGLALAVCNYDEGMADAISTKEVSDADALAAATTTWAAAEGTPWASEQSTIAADAAAYTGSVAPERDTLTHEEDDEAYDTAVATDQADETRDSTIAGDQYDETLVEDAENLDLANDKADADHTRAYDDAEAWQTNEDTSSDVDETFTDNVAPLQQARGTRDAAIGQKYANLLVKVDYDGTVQNGAFLTDPNPGTIMQEEIAALDASRVQYQLAEVGEKSTRAKGKTEAAYVYQVTYHGDEAEWAKTLELEAQDDEEHTAAAIDAQAKLDAAAVVDDVETTAGEQAGEATTDAADEAQFFNDQAGYQQTEDVDDAGAQATFEETTADDYANELVNWARRKGVRNRFPNRFPEEANPDIHPLSLVAAWRKFPCGNDLLPAATVRGESRHPSFVAGSRLA